MKTHVLTPMLPDGTPGEIKEVLANDEAPTFLEPVNPYLLNDSELSMLRSAVSDAETALRHAKSKKAGAAEVTRLDKALTTAKRELDTVEYELRRKRQREQVGADSPFARQTLAELVASTVEAVQVVCKKIKLPCNASPRCVAGKGKYQCARCRAKAAA